MVDEVTTDGQKTLILPLSFGQLPPVHALAAYQVLTYPSSFDGHWLSLYRHVARVLGPRQVTGGGDVDIALQLDPSKPVQPREILKALSGYGPTLRPMADDKNNSRINRDLLHISLRTILSIVLTIPILVLVWSPSALLDSTTSQSIQLALATLIIIVAWPVYSGSFRSAYYLHRADLGVLTSFATLTSYLFSVIAFGLEMSGRNIGEPFFETVGLLITLIFAGRTLQASTRKLGLQAVGNLGRLQPEQARLISPDGHTEELIDVR